MNLPTCNGHGICVQSLQKNEYERYMATTSILPGVDTTTKPGRCSCEDGWIGAACSKMECPELCHGNGRCVVRLART